MRIFIIPALAASLALSGCITADTKLRENLVKVCEVLEIAYGTYTDLEATLPIEQKYKDAIKAAYDPAHTICLTPETATTFGVVSRVIAAGVRIYAILTQITQSSPAAMEAVQ